MRYSDYQATQTKLDSWGKKPTRMQVVVYLSLIEAGKHKGRVYEQGNIEVLYDVDKIIDKYGKVAYNVSRADAKVIDTKGSTWHPTRAGNIPADIPCDELTDFSEVVDCVHEDFNRQFNKEGVTNDRGKELQGWTVTTKELITAETRGLGKPPKEMTAREYLNYIKESYDNIEKSRRSLMAMKYEDLTPEKASRILKDINEKREEIRKNIGLIQETPRIKTISIEQKEIMGIPYNTRIYTKNPLSSKTIEEGLITTDQLVADLRDTLNEKVKRKQQRGEQK